MSILKGLKGFFGKYFFNVKWRCNVCGKEIFNERYFCEECEKSLPFIDGPFCQHCGRKTLAAEEYCSTCKGKIVNVDKARSVFNYEKPISGLIKKAKYDNDKYLLEIFSEYLYLIYSKNYFNADYICCVPMTDKAKKKRGYNQSEELAKGLSKMSGVEFIDCISKVKETERQAKLKREERLKNLLGAYRIKSRKAIKGKSILIVDDVTTTGATAETVAEKLKKAGAKTVYLVTVASVPPREKY